MNLFLSGDFSEATDGMHPAFSSAFAKLLYLYGFFNEVQYKIVDACMKGHKLYYPNLDWNTVDKFDLKNYISNYSQKPTGPIPKDPKLRKLIPVPKVIQTWGQLMGSPISFIILCYCNAAVSWTAGDYYFGRKISFGQWVRVFRPLFNGDDHSSVTNRTHFRVWKSVASCAGLNSTLGKSYCSSKFILINSELFWPTMFNEQVDGIEDMFVLNPGLIKGQAKVLGDTRNTGKAVNVNDLLPLCDQLEKAISKANPLERILCKRIFLGHVEDRIKSTHRPWAVPRCLGGLGLQDISEPNYSQRLVTGWLLMQPDARKVITPQLLEYHAHVEHVGNFMRKLEAKLGCVYENFEMVSHDEYGIREYFQGKAHENLFGEKPTEFSVDDCFIGEGTCWIDPKKLRGDGYSKLMKSTISRSKNLVHPVSDDKLQILFSMKYMPRRVDEPILFF